MVSMILHMFIEDKYQNWVKWFGEEEAQRLRDYSFDLLQEVTSYWNLTNIKPLQGGYVSLIVCANFQNKEVVCKIPLNHDAFSQTISEADYLQAINIKEKLGPEILDVYKEKVILMEKLPLNNHLNQIGFSPEQQARTLGKLAKKLQASPLTSSAVPLDIRLVQDHWWVVNHKKQALTNWVNSLEGEKKLLHLDLHPQNVIHTPQGWKVIDPKPTLGISEFDLHGLFYSKRKIFWEEAQFLLQVYCQEAGMDYQKALKFLTLRAILNQEFLEKEPDKKSIFHFDAWLDNPEKEVIKEEFNFFLRK